MLASARERLTSGVPMFERMDFARLMLPVVVIVAAFLINITQIKQIDAPFAVYQVRVLERVIYFCPDRPSGDAECGYWTRRTHTGSSV